MKQTLLILALITATIQTFAQSPRIKLNQITKDSLTGSVLISSPTDSGMVYSRDLFISYGADTFLILGGDTLAATSGIISSVLSDGVTITGDGTTGSELTVDTATVIATKQDLDLYYLDSNPDGYTSNTGTVTSVGGTGTVNGISLSGTVTSSGNLTLGGTLSNVNLASQVTGTLPIANGGTGATSFTLGRVLFGNGTSAINTDGDLFWDNTNKRLGVGTTSVNSKFTVYSDAASSVDGVVTNNVYAMRIINSPTAGSGNFNVFDVRMSRGGIANRNPFFSFSTDNTDGDFYNVAQIGSIADLDTGYNIAGNLIFSTKPSGSAIAETMRIKSNGYVGIGTASPSHPLEMGSGAHVTSGGTWTNASDVKLKNNINYIYPYGLSQIMNLKPVVFDYKNGEKNTLGFIAQDVYEFIPEAISSTLDKYGNETMGLKMVSITATLTKAIQEQQAKIESQATEIEQLKTQIELILSEIEQIKNN